MGPIAVTARRVEGAGACPSHSCPRTGLGLASCVHVLVWKHVAGHSLAFKASPLPSHIGLCWPFVPSGPTQDDGQKTGRGNRSLGASLGSRFRHAGRQVPWEPQCPRKGRLRFQDTALASVCNFLPFFPLRLSFSPILKGLCACETSQATLASLSLRVLPCPLHLSTCHILTSPVPCLWVPQAPSTWVPSVVQAGNSVLRLELHTHASCPFD